MPRQYHRKCQPSFPVFSLLARKCNGLCHIQQSLRGKALVQGLWAAGTHDRMAYLLSLEDVLVELLLQPLIGQVDAQLLKAVLLEALEAINIQYANGALGTLTRTCCSRHPKLLTRAQLV